MHPSLRLRVGLGEHDRALARVEMPTADGVAPSFPFVRVWFADVGANAPEDCQFAGLAGRPASSEECPSSDDLRHIAGLPKGGSGSSVIEIMRHAVDAASDGLRLSGA